MSLYSYDAAYPPSLDQLAAGSPTAVACYLTGNFAVPNTWPAQIKGRGWLPVANYEQAANELVTAGRAGGQAVGQRALAAAQHDGFPAGSSIFYSVDVDVPQTTAAFEQVGAAFDGINDITKGHYCTHYYGEGALGEYLVNTGRICAGYWLSASSGFPGYNPQSPNVAMYQLAGASPVPNTDQNIITHLPALHAWGGSTTEDDMFEQADRDMLVALDKRLAAFDQEAYAISQMLPAVAEERANVQAILKAVSAAQRSSGVTVDDTKLAADLATSLQASLPAAVVTQLAAALTKGAPA